ncbi:hypothetical protein EYC84_000438 [Monilinia fructicola]|uniref:Uncharacterized protein n=1 Tax=Monilinia fructicola TaxID=38448 RepID=A0A5M9JNK9_MONFR|nr:hypothetical protein EYC84_000438 [Monilinia fructicola]
MRAAQRGDASRSLMLRAGERKLYYINTLKSSNLKVPTSKFQPQSFNLKILTLNLNLQLQPQPQPQPQPPTPNPPPKWPPTTQPHPPPHPRAPPHTRPSTQPRHAAPSAPPRPKPPPPTTQTTGAPTSTGAKRCATSGTGSYCTCPS